MIFWRTKCDILFTMKLWFIICYLYVGKTGCYNLGLVNFWVFIGIEPELFQLKEPLHFWIKPNLISHWTWQLKPCIHSQSFILFTFQINLLITMLNYNPFGDNNLLLYDTIGCSCLILHHQSLFRNNNVPSELRISLIVYISFR